MVFIFQKKLINNTTSILHFDSDALIVSKLENIWNKFKQFNDKEIMGAADDCGADKFKLNNL